MSEPNPAPSLRRSLIQGSLWMVAMRWCIRGIGLVSTVILARLLVPEDFGLVAMAMLVVGLTETMFAFGVDAALIYDQKATRRHYDTAWTIQLGEGVLAAACIWLLAPFAASYFDDPRVTELIRFIAVGVAISGLRNIGVVDFRKELRFQREFLFLVAHKIGTFSVTVPLAFALQSYWALAIGIVSGQVLKVVLSYLMHPYRPRPSLAELRSIWSFSQWMLLIHVGEQVSARTDSFLAGGNAGTADMGIYAVSSEIAALPTAELIYPMSRTLFPGFSKLRAEPERFRAAYLNVLGFLSTLSFPAAAGLAFLAQPFVALVLGSKWAAAVPFVQCLAAYGALWALYGNAAKVLMALGKVRLLALLTWTNAALLVVLGQAAVSAHGLIGLAATKVLITAGLTLASFHLKVRASGLSWGACLARLWRPVVAVAVMLSVLTLAAPLLTLHPLIALVLGAALGAAAYGATLLMLWNLSGRPPGAESFLIGVVSARLGRRPAPGAA